MIIVGAKKYDFVSKDTGENVTGYTCYACGEPGLSDKNVIGFAVEKFSVSMERFDSYGIRKLIEDKTPVELVYNRYGKVSELRLIQH